MRSEIVRLGAWGVILAFSSLAAEAAPAQPLTLNRTRYQLRAGEAVSIDAPRQTLDFVRTASSRTIRIVGPQTTGFVLAPNLKGDDLLLAASLTTRPGDYTVTVSAINSSGITREAAVNATVSALQTVSSTATEPPVVLLNGWENGITNICAPEQASDTFGDLAQQLEAAPDNVPVVYFFDNCVEGPNQSIEMLGSTLGQVLNMIQYDNGAQVPQIDLIGHSMGGLIARSYLAGLQTDGTLSPPANTLVRKLIEIATPNFGSYLAANYSALISSGTQAFEMIPASAFLWDLGRWNQGVDDLRGVDALAIIGNQGSWFPSLTGSALPNASDGVVSLTSASLSFAEDNSHTRILPYCHIDSTSGLLGGLINCRGHGIANTSSNEAPETGQIIVSFLASTSDWMSIGSTPSQDPYLSQYGGLYFGLENAAGTQYGNLTQVSWGPVAFQNGGATNLFFYDEFVKGTGTFQATAGTTPVGCGSFTEPAGYYTSFRCKYAPDISSVTPLLAGTGTAKIVQAGAAITVNGTGFGNPCSTCQVLAYPGKVALQVLAWSDSAITAFLPSSFTGFVQITVQIASGADTINIMAALPPTVPTITLVANAFTDAPPIAPNTWLEIKGMNLAPAGDSRIWQASDFVNNQMPTQLDGVSVMVNGKSAYIWYISGTQVNILTPPDTLPASVQVVLTTGNVATAAFTVQAQALSPSIDVVVSPGGSHYAVAHHGDGSFVGPASLYPGLSTPAAPDEEIALAANGFGPTSTAVVSGSVMQSGALPTLPVITIGGMPATVRYDNLVSPGTFQFNVVVPPGAPNGDLPLMIVYNGSSTQAGVFISVQQ